MSETPAEYRAPGERETSATPHARRETPALERRIRQYLAYLAGQCAGCFRRGAACTTCAIEPAAGLLREMGSGQRACGRRHSEGRALRQQLRQALGEALAGGAWVSARELGAIGRRLGATYMQTKYQLQGMSATLERRGKTNRMEYRRQGGTRKCSS